MDRGSDQAGAPGTTPTKTPADSGSRVHVRTGRCTRAHFPPPFSEEIVYSCKVKHGKEETNYPPDRWVGVREARSFFLP